MERKINAHNLADVQTKNIGEYTKNMAVLYNFSMSKNWRNCNIFTYCFIENDVLIVPGIEI
jgi:hypothetical protein